MSDFFTEINQRYLLGERNFHQHNFSKANLKGINLAQANLKNSDLSFANLENANLTDANLSKCNLKGANLTGANLTNAIIDDSDLSYSKLNKANLSGIHGRKANFRQAYLNNVNLQKAYLSGANFTQSSLNNSDLSYSNLKRTEFQNAFLTGVNLTEAYLSESSMLGTCLTSAIIYKTYFREAKYNHKTIFDTKFNPQLMGMISVELNNFTIEDVLKAINYLSKCSQKYLGVNLVVKYLHSSKLENDWLNKFQVDNYGNVIYLGSKFNYIDDFQLKWYRQWVKEYFNRCSFIINNFRELIQDDLSSSPYQIHLPLAA
ncbi:pentapeptide repeat protein [Geminocystis sp. NIES-3708]|uniref:pentapeptide repeat-containing protein n=1 Tax=Geminocystis sp. NIES-3708 TaxID=1615909 RepID=UPI0005FC4B34|nr:pentapeptide repeat-containing protein [Geminocystis sp. NIES-3708]BAQ62804.1 pentapeptide repeat protein [Geminocystis sp. NIES-3708]